MEKLQLEKRTYALKNLLNQCLTFTMNQFKSRYIFKDMSRLWTNRCIQASLCTIRNSQVEHVKGTLNINFIYIVFRDESESNSEDCSFLIGLRDVRDCEQLVFARVANHESLNSNYIQILWENARVSQLLFSISILSWIHWVFPIDGVYDELFILLNKQAKRANNSFRTATSS